MIIKYNEVDDICTEHGTYDKTVQNCDRKTFTEEIT
jgi:hypothetical protein